MNRVMNLTFESSLTELCEKNSSFDAGVLRIAYPGVNRNGSEITKEAFENALPSIKNVPVVAHYKREEDEFGGHDMEIVRDDEGDLKLVNLTTPVGVVPESADQWWATVTEEDGTEHEYLYTDVLLWKRQEAYEKIKRDGVASHSMEITVLDGETVDGIYKIKAFEFTAFTIIGVEPCFESSQIEVFSAREFKARLNAMMADLRESYNLVTTSKEVDDIHPQTTQTEGGETELENEVVETVVEETVGTETVDEATVEEPVIETEPVSENEGAADNGEEFELGRNIVNGILEALSHIVVECEWGEHPRYWFVDYDPDIGVAYVEDWDDCHLYGFNYTTDGDRIIIDFESGVRKKWAIVDFDEGDTSDDPITSVFTEFASCRRENAQYASVIEESKGQITAFENELNELREAQNAAQREREDAERDAVFAQFSDLDGNDAFEALRQDCEGLDAETLSEKCFAIRGRLHTPKFAYENKGTKLKIETKDESKDNSNEPYGDLFERFGDK